MKKLFIVVAFFLIFIIAVLLSLPSTRFTWREPEGPAVVTCTYRGIWNPDLNIRLVLSERCMLF